MSEFLQVSVEAMRISSGADFWANTLCHELRYCPKCIQLGYHSYLFQYLGIYACPLHTCLLQTGCFKCKCVIQCDLPHVAGSPFACPRCGVLFKRKRFQQELPLYQMRAIDALIGDFRRARRRVAITSRSSGPPGFFSTGDSLFRLSGVKQVQLARVISRYDDWREPLIAHWRFKTVDYWVPTGRKTQHVLTRHEDGVGTKTLTTLFQMLAPYQEECSALHIRNSYPSGVRIEGQAMRIAVALCLLCNQLQIWPLWNAYWTARAIDGRPGAGMDLSARMNYLHRAGLTDKAARQIAEIIGEQDILGLFCCILRKLRKALRLSQVEWWSSIERYQYECGVRMQLVAEHGHKLQVRPRASWEMVDFLCRRYRDRVLHPGVSFDDSWRIQ
ncbi:DUF3445 domain-containing protein [Pandoraea sp. PE-S2R-1]|uniref:DUF3445 domain-containing protein n=1 Tax=Pandoraea sp. PE-S2R-1 TaxID=1986994 RepID=UPI001130C9EB|nr:DUF3445 domain-containing protein [Pandoraea sp. PE-S2R-1]